MLSTIMNAPQPEILLSGFADEAAKDKTLDQQFSAFAALGLDYFTIRFLNLGQGVKNVMALDQSEIQTVQVAAREFGLRVSSIGSPIGKIKLRDQDDGTTTPYRPFEAYLNDEVRRACSLAQAFGTRLIRGFSFYHPKATDYRDYLSEVVDRLGRIAELCSSEGLVFGLEVEANLVGQNGFVLAEIHQQISHPSLVLIFDGGNLVMQGYSTAEVFSQYLAMKPGLGWIHIKDFRSTLAATGDRPSHVDEEAVKDFVPSDLGDSGHLAILKDLAGFLPQLRERMVQKGAPGVFVDLEPHLRGGGQFGGFSGPDGFGIALRAFCSICQQAGVRYRLRDFSQLYAERTKRQA
jgi:sugar phosphate isomerase/epimerase